MRSFLIRLTVFTAIQVAVFFAFLYDPDLALETNYLAATLDKHRRLAAARPPRILLIGSSSFAFGVNSERLEREFARPTVNMGLDGSLGLDFLLGEIRNSIRAGDLVVLSLEPFLFQGGVKELKQRQILDFRPSAFWSVDARVRFGLLNEHVVALAGSWARRSFRIPSPSPLPRRSGAEYSREGFNAWGDYVAHRRMPGRMAAGIRTELDDLVALQDGWGRPRPVEAGLRDRLAAFAIRCNELGARLVFTWPPVPPDEMKRQAAYLAHARVLVESIAELHVIDAPEDHVYDLSLFYDTRAHLTGEGAEERTARLIRNLRAFLERTRSGEHSEPRKDPEAP